jgi:arabinogalactan oligomer/maltooligosaccharide transport system permease protein
MLAVLAFIWVLPVIWIILTSFRGEKGSYVTTFLPKTYTWGNYIRLFTDRTVLNFPRMFMNTLIIAIFSCAISTFFVLSVSYCMSRMRFRFRKVFMNTAMILTLFPAFLSMVAVYYILKAIGLSEGAMIRVALVLVYSGSSGLGFYIAKGFFDTIPMSLDEAALLDGATQWQVFTKVTIPLSKPIIVYTILTAFIGPWVDFIFAKVICRANAKYYTGAIGLWNMLQKEYIHDWYTCFAAGAVVISIPIAVLFVYMQRYYVEGMAGAVKG